jgi:polyvinyl alcohol dehydrogenase (cytochrome)
MQKQILAVTLLLLVATSSVLAGKPTKPKKDPNWNGWGKNTFNDRYQSKDIDHLNNGASVKSFVQQFFFPAQVGVSATPTVHGNRIYFPDFGGNIYCLDRQGRQIWNASVPQLLGLPNYLTRNSPVLYDDLLIFGSQYPPLPGLGRGAFAFALNKNNGHLEWTTLLDAHLNATITQSPTVVEDSVIFGVSSHETSAAAEAGYPCCTFRGSVVKLDAQSGAKQWQQYTVPDNNGQVGGYSGAAVWGSAPSIDTDRRLVFVGTSQNYQVPARIAECINKTEAIRDYIFAEPCHEEGNHANSILALDLDSGIVRWSYFAPPIDAWTAACGYPGFPPTNTANCPGKPGPDADFAQAPVLVREVAHPLGGEPRDMIFVSQKSGISWAFDAETGQKIWATQVGPGGIVGGSMWGSASDGKSFYTANFNSQYQPYTLVNGSIANLPFWASVNLTSGVVNWQFLSTNGGAFGPVTVWDEIVVVGSTGGSLYGLRKSDGKLLYTTTLNNGIFGGASVSQDTIYIGTGYGYNGVTVTNPALAGLYAFKLPNN